LGPACNGDDEITVRTFRIEQGGGAFSTNTMNFTPVVP